MGKRNIAFICVREHEADDSLSRQLKEAFGGIYIANERFNKEQATAWLVDSKADAIAFGIPFIANPDLPERLAQDAPLNEPRPETFYASGPVGYIDYPRL
ncbi:N-ethylmaleimide reductase [compost metagenome]